MMKIKEILDISDIDEIEKMSPEECKGLLKGFFIGAGFVEAFKESVDEMIDKRYKEKKIHSKNSYTSLLRQYRQDRQDFRHITLEFRSREDAMDVFDELEGRLINNKENYVTVHDLYSLADLPTNTAMLNWVWYELDDPSIERVGDNYILKMPPAELKNPYRS